MIRSEDEAGVQHRNPYAAPTSDAESDLSRPTHPVQIYGRYRGQRRLTQLLGAILGLQALLVGTYGAVCVTLVVTGDSHVTDSLLAASVSLNKARLVTYYVGVIPFGYFLVRANRNARAFVAAVRDPDDEASLFGRQPVHIFSPASMVWWFAVPILNLVRPYQAVRAVWFNSGPNSEDGASALQSGVVSVWWGTWLASTCWNLGMRWFGQASSYATHDLLLAVGSGVDALNCFFALSMLRALERRQSVRAAELWPG